MTSYSLAPQNVFVGVIRAGSKNTTGTSLPSPPPPGAFSGAKTHKTYRTDRSDTMTRWTPVNVLGFITHSPRMSYSVCPTPPPYWGTGELISNIHYTGAPVMAAKHLVTCTSLSPAGHLTMMGPLKGHFSRTK